MLTRNQIEIDGKRLETEWHGPPPEEALTLVFLHEGLGCVSMWRNYPSRLAVATGCSALVYSRLGYGRSDACSLPRSVSFMHHEGLNILPALLDLAGITQCVLVGHSDGGSIAIVYAGGTPALPLKGLITEAAHVFCEELSVRSIEEARKRYLHGDLKQKLEKHHGANTECAFWGWNDVWLNPDFMQWNLEEFLPDIQVPMLAIQGDQDQYGTPAQLEAIVKKAGGETESLMLRDCGHSPHIEQPEATFRAMKHFILKIRSQMR
jgi:pimeloyl-ACP methyl ester carboxylesterase